MFCLRIPGGSDSWVRNKNSAGECEYCWDRAQAMPFATVEEALAYVAGEKRRHQVVEFATDAVIKASPVAHSRL